MVLECVLFCRTRRYIAFMTWYFLRGLRMLLLGRASVRFRQWRSCCLRAVETPQRRRREDCEIFLRFDRNSPFSLRPLSFLLSDQTNQLITAILHSSFSFHNKPFTFLCFLLQITFTGTFTVSIVNTRHSRLLVDQPRNVKYLPPWLNGSQAFDSDNTTHLVSPYCTARYYYDTYVWALLQTSND